MKNEILTTNQASVLVSLEEKTQAYLRKGLTGAVNTERAYQTDVRLFQDWCATQQLQALPCGKETLVLYLSALADTCKWATLQRKIAAIRKWHLLSGYELPNQAFEVKAILEGIKRSIGIKQQQAPAYSLAQFKQIIKSLDNNDLVALRNKSLLLIGFTGAFRRSELVNLDVADLSFTESGLVINNKISKTNQYGNHEEKAIFYSPDPDLCPVRTLKKWIESSFVDEAVWVRIRKNAQMTTQRLSDKSVNNIFQHYFGKEYSAHSMRASFITIAKINGADDSEIMRQTKHKTNSMIQRYTRINDIKLHNAALKLGL